MLFQDKLDALTFLLMLRSGNLNMPDKHPAWGYLDDAGFVDSYNLRLTDKGWETANRLANEFGELL